MRRLFACLCCLFACAAGAAEISVLPVGLVLSAAQDRKAVTVSNGGKEAVAVQVEAVAWAQENGADQYTPTHDLLVNPQVFSLPPGGSQVVRVGLRQPADRQREVAYRLFVRELPPPPQLAASVVGQQIRVLMELRLPVYVAPADPRPAQEWRARRQADGSLAVEVANVGNVHFVVAGLRLRSAVDSADAPPLATLATSTTVLAGQRRRWEFRAEAGRAVGNSVTLEVLSERGAQHVALELGGN